MAIEDGCYYSKRKTLSWWIVTQLLVKINLFFFHIGSEYDYQVIGLRMHNIYRVQHGVPQLALNEAVSKFMFYFFSHVFLQELFKLEFCFIFLKNAK